MVDPPGRYGCPTRTTDRVYAFPNPKGFWTYELVITLVWVDEAPNHEVPDLFRAWFKTTPYGLRIGPLLSFDVPAEVINAAKDVEQADLPDGDVEDPSSRPDQVDPESPEVESK